MLCFNIYYKLYFRAPTLAHPPNVPTSTNCALTLQQTRQLLVLPNVRLTTKCVNAPPNLLQIETAMWRFLIDPNMTCVNMSSVQLINLCVIHVTCHVNLLSGVIVPDFHVISGGSHCHVSNADCTATCHPATWFLLLGQNFRTRYLGHMDSV
jgi:hypothetical protein